MSSCVPESMLCHCLLCMHVLAALLPYLTTSTVMRQKNAMLLLAHCTVKTCQQSATLIHPRHNSQQVAGCQQADADRALNGVTKQTERGPVITFTVDDQDRVMTVEEVGKISAAEFQNLYSVCMILNVSNS